MTCPICAGALSALTDPASDTAPWRCPSCFRGWWNAELTTEARGAFDAATRSFTAEMAEQLELEILIEQES